MSSSSMRLQAPLRHRRLPGVLLAGLFAGSLWAGGEPLQQQPEPVKTAESEPAKAIKPEPAQAAEPSPAKPALAAGLPWQEVYYEASNIWASASSRVRLYPVATRSIGDEWLQPADQAEQSVLQPGGPLTYALIAESQVARNRENVSLWFEPDDWGSYQRCRVSYGRSNSRAHCYIYYPDEVYRERRASSMTSSDVRGGSDWADDGPESAAELARDWRLTNHRRLPVPAGVPDDASWVSPQALLPLASVAPLREVGDRYQVYVHTDHDFYRVTLTVTGTERSSVRYDLRQPASPGRAASSRNVRGSVNALVIAVSAEPLRPPEDDFEIFGLESPVALLLDPDSRLPLEIRGTAPRLGSSAIRLNSARLMPATAD